MMSRKDAVKYLLSNNSDLKNILYENPLIGDHLQEIKEFAIRGINE